MTVPFFMDLKMIYNIELVEKISYGSEFGSYGVIEEIDIPQRFVDTVLRINFTEGEHGLLVNSEDPNYILCGHGLFSVSEAIVQTGDYVTYQDGYAQVIAEGIFNEDTKTFVKTPKSNALKVKLDNGNLVVLIKTNMDTRFKAVNINTGEISAVDSKIMFDNAEKAVKMYIQDMSSDVFDDSLSDFEEWE